MTTTPDTVKVSTVVLIIFATIIITVIALDMSGAIKHSENKTDAPVAGYKVIFIENMDDKSYRLSHKSSDQTAVCKPVGFTAWPLYHMICQVAG